MAKKAMPQLYACLNCADVDGNPGKLFTADVPVCPCGIDGRDADVKHLIQKRVVVHYLPPHPKVTETKMDKSVMRRTTMKRRSCDGGPMADVGPTPAWISSACVGAVNCPACMATPAYLERTNGKTVEVKEDFGVIVKEGGQVVRS